VACRLERGFGTSRLFAGLAAAVMVAGLLGAGWTASGEGRAEARQPEPGVAEQLRVARDLSDAFGHVAEKVSPAVVHITAREERVIVRRDFFGRRYKRPNVREGQGSGVIVSPDGYVLTNNHVVGDATEEPTVRLMDGREFKARVIGTAPLHDLAVLKINDGTLPYVELGDSDRVRVGEWVLAMGSPFGFESSVTAGIVSATQRAGLGLTSQRYRESEEFIQTDAAINPGNSGGPLVNLDGEVIGINSAIASRGGGSVGIGFAIPSELARAVMENLIRSGEVELGWLGMLLEPNPGGGVRVEEVVEGAPAARYGLRDGDVVKSYRGRVINDVEKLIRAIQYTPPGTRAEVLIDRGNRSQSLEVVVGDPIKEQVQLLGGRRLHSLGLTAATFSEQALKILGVQVPRGLRGVVLIDVEPGSPAEVAGFEEGDVIIGVEQVEVEDIRDLQLALERYGPRRPVRFYVQRGREQGYLDLGG